MTEPVIIRLAGEPRGKGRHRSRLAQNGAGETFIATHSDPATKAYEGRLKDAAAVVMLGRPLLDGPLAVAVWAYRSIPASLSKRKRELALADGLRPTTKPDLDNYAKTLDALNGIVWRDDALVVQGFFAKLYADRPELVIRVEAWTPEARP